MSTALPDSAQKIIASFYSQLFGNNRLLATPRMPFHFELIDDFKQFHPAANELEFKQAFTILREKLDPMGVRVPVLYKQYAELCQPGGCEFLGFNIDPQFSNCVDALILIHVQSIKEKKYQRYIGSHAIEVQDIHSA